MDEITNFNIRVYGLIINHKKEILTSIEHYGTRRLHKFVGGGLEKGEGLKDGLVREFREELDCEITVGALYYINDFFQQSFFKKEDQIISVYYTVEPKSWANFDEIFNSKTLGQELLWTKLESFDTSTLSLPIDKIVIEKLKNRA